MPAIIVSRNSVGRPLLYREAIKSAACCAATASKAATLPPISSARTSSSACMSCERLRPDGRISNPNRSSSSVMEVVRQNVPHRAFHAAPVPRGATLELFLHLFLDIANDQLSHRTPPTTLRYHDITSVSIGNDQGCVRKAQE